MPYYKMFLIISELSIINLFMLMLYKYQRVSDEMDNWSCAYHSLRKELPIWAVSIHILLQYQYQIFKALVSEELDSVFSMRTEFPSMVYETSE